MTFCLNINRQTALRLTAAKAPDRAVALCVREEGDEPKTRLFSRSANNRNKNNTVCNKPVKSERDLFTDISNESESWEKLQSQGPGPGPAGLLSRLFKTWFHLQKPVRWNQVSRSQTLWLNFGSHLVKCVDESQLLPHQVLAELSYSGLCFGHT